MVYSRLSPVSWLLYPWLIPISPKELKTEFQHILFQFLTQPLSYSYSDLNNLSFEVNKTPCCLLSQILCRNSNWAWNWKVGMMSYVARRKCCNSEKWNLCRLNSISSLIVLPVNLKFLFFFVKEFRDKVICKKQIHLERSTLHRVWAISGVKRKRERERERELWNMVQLVFMSCVIL